MRPLVSFCGTLKLNMLDYIKFLWKKKFVLFSVLLVSFVIGYFVCSYIFNNNKQEFESRVQYSDSYATLLDEENVRNSAVNVLSKAGERLITDKQIKELLKESNLYLEEVSDGFIIHIKAKYLGYNASRGNKLVNNLCSTLPLEFTIVYDSVVTTHTFNPYYAGLIAVLCGMSIALVSLFFSKKATKDKEEYVVCDNEEVFSTIFHKKYWKYALNKKLKVKDLCVISVLFAMMMVCKAIVLPSGFSNLGLSFTFLFFATISLLYGPFMGLFIGFFSDILGFFLFPTGYAFFFPYTLNAMLTGFLYGIFFYKTKITYSKVFICRVFVNMIINVILGSIWMGMISEFSKEQTITYMLFTSLPKNLVYLLPQSILLYILFKSLGRVFLANNMIDRRICENITLF